MLSCMHAICIHVGVGWVCYLIDQGFGASNVWWTQGFGIIAMDDKDFILNNICKWLRCNSRLTSYNVGMW